MSGKLCFGNIAPLGNSFHPKTSKALAEGIQHRSGGTAIARPISDNPHESGSDAYNAWAYGWNQANDIAGGTTASSTISCVNLPSVIPL